MHRLIGFISDAHGNVGAFDRGVELLLGLGAQHIYFLGDAIGYVPTVKVLESLMRWRDRVSCVRGNHEAMLLHGPVDPERDTVYQLEATRLQMSPQQLEMINSWPDRLVESFDRQRLLMVHGSPSDPTYGYVYPDTDLAQFEPRADWVFMGNTHHPFIRKHANTCYVNVGSCGMPRDDGRYGSVALWSAKDCTARIFRFDIAAQSGELFEEFPKVHSSVRDVYARRRDRIAGDIL